jgi:protein TonB
MVAARIKGVQNQSAKAFVGPPPEYPEALAKRNLGGIAIVSFQIAGNGGVQEARLKSASDPALGESALTAIRLWRFLPRIKDGRAIPARAEMPFIFGTSKSDHKTS